MMCDVAQRRQSGFVADVQWWCQSCSVSLNSYVLIVVSVISLK